MDIQCSLHEYRKKRGEPTRFLGNLFDNRKISLATTLKHAKGDTVEIGEILSIILLGWEDSRANTVEFLGIVNLYFNMLLDRMDLEFPALLTLEASEAYLQGSSSPLETAQDGKEIFAIVQIAKHKLIAIAEQISEQEDVSINLAHFCTELYDLIAFKLPKEHQPYAVNALLNLLSMKFIAE